MRYALKRPITAGAVTLVVASSWSSSVALAGCAATALSASAGVFGPPSISATESSTAQALELIRQRRMQVAEACPTGFTRSGGICQPIAQSAAAEPAPVPAAALPGTASATPPSSTVQVPGASAAPVRAKATPRPRTTVAAADPTPRSAPASAPTYGGGSLKDYPADIAPAGRLIGTWIEGFADWEKHDDVRPDIAGGQTRESYTTGLLSGIDATDAPKGIQLGMLGGYTYSQAKFAPYRSSRAANDDGTIDPNAFTFDQKQSIEGTSLGLYGAYFNNTGFSADLLYKIDLFDLTQSDSVASDQGCGNIQVFNAHGETTMTNHIVAANFYWRWDVGGGRWIEPTLGLRYTHTGVGGNAVNLGLEDGDAFRIQGGIRFGHVWTSGSYVITTGLTGLLYSDVLVDGFVTPGIGIAPGIGEIDEGKLRVMGIAQAKIDTPSGAQWYGQVDVRGGEDLIGVGGKIGVRMRW